MNRTPQITITAANKTRTKTECSGTLNMTPKGREITLKGVLYHPKFYNLISGPKLRDHRTTLKGCHLEVRFTDNFLLYTIERDSNRTMWVTLNASTPMIAPCKVVTLKINRVPLQDLHKRYRHISYPYLPSLSEAKNIIELGNWTCHACLYRKSTKPASKSSSKAIRSTLVLERIYAELIGQVPKQWLGQLYIFTAMDDYSRFCMAIPINHKSEASQKIKQWMLAIESQTEKRVANLQTDEEKEFLKIKA